MDEAWNVNTTLQNRSGGGEEGWTKGKIKKKKTRGKSVHRWRKEDVKMWKTRVWSETKRARECLKSLLSTPSVCSPTTCTELPVSRCYPELNWWLTSVLRQEICRLLWGIESFSRPRQLNGREGDRQSRVRLRMIYNVSVIMMAAYSAL